MPEFRVCTLVSGSSGNAVYAACAAGAILIDAGVSGKKIAAALKRIGTTPEAIRGLLLTHDHSDHVQGVGVLARRYGWPIFMTRGTYQCARAKLGTIREPGFIQAGRPLSLAGFQIECLATPHDAAEPVALILERSGLRCGILTDLGHPFAALKETVSSLDAIFLESNYDPAMLANNHAYPEYLRRRIQSPAGHLSNEEAATLIREHASARLQIVMLAHLSENNNSPQLAAKTMLSLAGSRLADGAVRVEVAPRHAPSPIVVLRKRRVTKNE